MERSLVNSAGRRFSWAPVPSRYCDPTRTALPFPYNTFFRWAVPFANTHAWIENPLESLKFKAAKLSVSLCVPIRTWFLCRNAAELYAAAEFGFRPFDIANKHTVATVSQRRSVTVSPLPFLKCPHTLNRILSNFCVTCRYDCETEHGNSAKREHIIQIPFLRKNIIYPPVYY